MGGVRHIASGLLLLCPTQLGAGGSVPSIHLCHWQVASEWISLGTQAHATLTPYDFSIRTMDRHLHLANRITTWSPLLSAMCLSHRCTQRNIQCPAMRTPSPCLSPWPSPCPSPCHLISMSLRAPRATASQPRAAASHSIALQRYSHPYPLPHLRLVRSELLGLSAGL